MSHFVYHFKPANLQGTTLYPLNRLRDLHPEAHRSEFKKYVGREKLLEKRIPILDCLWNDVIHLSPLHPQTVIDCWKANGLFEYTQRKEKTVDVFKIPAAAIDWPNVVCFQSFNYEFGNFDLEKDKYWQIVDGAFTEQKDVSPEQLKVWKADQTAGRRLFWYSHTMHVLARQTLDVSGCEIVRCQ